MQKPFSGQNNKMDKTIRVELLYIIKSTRIKWYIRWSPKGN